MKGPAGEVCADRQRRAEIRARGHNGLDYLEVSDDQTTLTVNCLRRLPETLTREHVRIDGGVRIRDIRVLDLRLCSTDDPQEDDCFKVIVDKVGDFSTYTLRLVERDALGGQTETPLAGFDPRYAQLDFSFKAGLPSELDCVSRRLLRRRPPQHRISTICPRTTPASGNSYWVDCRCSCPDGLSGTCPTSASRSSKF